MGVNMVVNIMVVNMVVNIMVVNMVVNMVDNDACDLKFINSFMVVTSINIH